ncbi:hypothetical protein X756_09820 [Mesorhizobium sp. LSHC412B00]|nr:hypothetical protein X756_09820 [Mesorhizobium sp. LSHC412B00]
MSPRVLTALEAYIWPKTKPKLIGIHAATIIADPHAIFAYIDLNLDTGFIIVSFKLLPDVYSIQ